MRIYIHAYIILNLINNILYVIIAYLVFNEKTFHVYAEQLLFFFSNSEYEINSYNFNIFFNFIIEDRILKSIFSR